MMMMSVKKMVMSTMSLILLTSSMAAIISLMTSSLLETAMILSEGAWIADSRALLAPSTLANGYRFHPIGGSATCCFFYGDFFKFAKMSGRGRKETEILSFKEEASRKEHQPTLSWNTSNLSLQGT